MSGAYSSSSSTSLKELFLDNVTNQFEQVKMNNSRSMEEGLENDDDQHIYANVQEMEEESRRQEQPPTPDSTDQPIRDVGGGWYEYLTEAGRPYFYNHETGDCQWKPPRFLKPPSEVAAALNGLNDEPIVTVQCEGVETVDDITACCSEPFPTAVPTDGSNENSKASTIRSTLSVRNRVAEKRMSVQAITQELEAAAAGHLHLYKSNEDVGSDANCYLLPKTLGGEPCSSNYFNRLPSRNFTQKSIKCGTLEKCKVADAGTRIKKKEWSSCYLFLSSAHIIFYKDERSAEKSGRHYEAPLGMCDLRGATIQWVNEKDKRRKHVFQLELTDGTVYHFSTANSQDVNGWFHAMRQVVAKLPRPDTYPTPVLERSGNTVGLIRNSSNLSHSSGSFGVGQTRRSVKKSKTLGKDATVAGDEKKRADIEEARPTRESIIEKLKRFFRSRPSIESLKEKGIYKPEPVFGSTLAAICQHEQTTVPRFIQLVTEVIESKGLDTDGLYRVSGNLSSIQRIRCQVDQEKYVALLAEDDVHVLTGALKLFFRELSEPIFPASLAKDFIYANRLPNGESKVKAFDELLNKLPLINRETLKVLFGHLIRVSNHADKNRMEIHNLAIMFGPSLFSSGSEMNSDNKKTGSSKKCKGSDKKAKEKPPVVQSNSHLAFNMIMQGQTVEYLLKEYKRFSCMQSSPSRNKCAVSSLFRNLKKYPGLDAINFESVMKKKHLEWFLSEIETFKNPKMHLEQYSTSVELAEAILNAISDQGCIEGCSVADLGCGSGILLLGAVKLGASYGLGVEIDEEAVKICQGNIESCGLGCRTDVICLDVTKNASALRPIFESVIINPPFGTKNNAGIDLQFVEAGLAVLEENGKLFSLHKSSTRRYIEKYVSQKLTGIDGECIAELRWNLPATYAHHKRQSVDIEVDLWQFCNLGKSSSCR